MRLFEVYPEFAKALTTELDQRPGWNIKTTDPDYACDMSKVGLYYSLGFLGERVAISNVPKTVFQPVNPFAVLKMADYLEAWCESTVQFPDATSQILWPHGYLE